MSFPFNVYLLAWAGGFLATAATLPIWRIWCLRTGLLDDPGHRKIHSEPIPLAGGLAVLSGITIPLLLAVVVIRWSGLGAQAMEPLGYGLGKRSHQILALLGGAAAMVVLGWLDDKYELRPAWKFAGQFCIALAVASQGIRITLFIHNLWFSYAITILWILTVTNALNFMDNMNGLCAGLGAIGAAFFALHAGGSGQYLVASFCLLICGAWLGFLPYNFPHAKAFLGDSGSHLTGYLLAVLAILPHFYYRDHPRVLAVFTPLLVLAVPLADLVWVVVLRWRAGRPFYVGDTNHLSHRLVRRGFSRTQAVLLIWLLAALVATLAEL